jgi:phospholipid transport system substrate-binding protein
VGVQKTIVKECALKTFWCAVIILAGINQCLLAGGNEPNDPNNPGELLRVTSDKVVAVLQDGSLDKTAKTKTLDEIISPFFDFELMSKLSLGRANWGKLSESQQRTFVELFTKLLKNTYLDLLTLYKDQKLMLQPARPQKNGVSIQMDVVDGDKKLAIVYKLRQLQNRWLAYDVEVEGVSILMTYKAQFDDILKDGQVKDLFASLEKKSTK